MNPAWEERLRCAPQWVMKRAQGKVWGGLCVLAASGKTADQRQTGSQLLPQGGTPCLPKSAPHTWDESWTLTEEMLFTGQTTGKSQTRLFNVINNSTPVSKSQWPEAQLTSEGELKGAAGSV